MLDKQTLIQALNEYGLLNQKDLDQKLNKNFREFEQRQDKKLKRELQLVKKELLSAIANIALNSPTINQFTALEEKVDRLSKYS